MEEGLVFAGARGRVAEGAVDEEEFRPGGGGEGGGDVEVVAQEQAHGEVTGARFGDDAIEGEDVGCVDDEGGEFGVGVGEVGGEDGSESLAVGDDGGGRQVAGVEKVVEGGGGVFGHAGFGGVGRVALAEAAIVEGEEVEVGLVEEGEGGKGVRERADAVVEEEDRGRGRVCGGDPPGGEARVAGGGGVEANGIEGKRDGGGGLVDAGRRGEEALPAAGVDQGADGQVGEGESCDESQGEGFEEPCGPDVCGRARGSQGRSCSLWGGRSHRGEGSTRLMVAGVRMKGRDRMEQWVRLCGVAEAPAEGNVMEAEAGGVTVCLARSGGELLALDNLCPHRQGPLGQGWIEGNSVVCPWHSWAFDLRSGEAEFPVGERVKAFAVKVEGYDVLVSID